MSNGVVVTILAGGQGTRFWPISRMKRPKQFLSISKDGESLIQATAHRVEPLTGGAHGSGLCIVTNKLHEALIREHVPYARVLCEPVAKNTAASIGLAAIYHKHVEGDPVLLVLPADHAVKDPAALLETYRDAIAVARERPLLVTIGVPPTSPNTGYGYIKKGKRVTDGVFAVSRFFEKPNEQRALKYFESGEYLWNSGMFAWRCSTILAALQEHMPELYAGLLKIEAAIGTPQEHAVVAEVFAVLDSVSIDFGVLELAKNCAVVVGRQFGWNDVGSWDAWAEHFEVDENKNLKYGDALTIDSQNCVVHSKNRLIALVGVDDLVVIDSGDAMLVCPRSRVQDVRKVVEELKKLGRNDLM
jgi:mannose-1-phosphate guanylyltransferase